MMDAPKMPYWCQACRDTGAIHCAHPDECGNIVQYMHPDIVASAIASARAQALEEAAREAETCDYPWVSPTNEQADACNEMAERIAAAIRALSPTPDTTTPVIEAAKAVVANPRIRAVIVTLDGGDDLDRLAAALAAHEARHDRLR